MNWQLQISHTAVCNVCLQLSHIDDEEECDAAVLLPSPSLALTAPSGSRACLITSLHLSSLHELQEFLATPFASRMQA